MTEAEIVEQHRFMGNFTVPPQGVTLKGRLLAAGTVVHLYGIPVRLVSDVNVETSEGNLTIIDDRALGVQLASELAKVPPLSGATAGTKITIPVKGRVPTPDALKANEDAMEVLRDYARREDERIRERERQLRPQPWFDSDSGQWLQPVVPTRTYNIPQIQAVASDR